MERRKRPTYKDERGYTRTGHKHSNLIHRQNAYRYIYLKHKNEYPLPFSSYDVHHIDGNKNNNHSDNLRIVTREEHEVLHQKKRSHSTDYPSASYSFKLSIWERIDKGVKLGMLVSIILAFVFAYFEQMGWKNAESLPFWFVGIFVLCLSLWALFRVIEIIYILCKGFWEQVKEVFGK